MHFRYAIALGIFVCGSFEGTTYAAAEITPGELRAHVEYLASDELKGRETGERGCELAEEFIANHFDDVDLDVLPGAKSYYLPYELYTRTFDRKKTRLELRADKRKYKFSPGEEMRPFPFSGQGHVKGKVAFVGYGITAPDLGHDDYRDIDVKGKIVLLLRYEPGKYEEDSRFNGTQSTTHALFTTKANNAKAHGAKGMLLVTGPHHAQETDDFRLPRGFSLQPGGESGSEIEFLAAHIDRQTLSKALARLDLDLETLQADAEKAQASRLLDDLEVDLRIRREPADKTVTTRNVAGIIHGSDPELRDEWIVVGAHHDHVGSRAGFRHTDRTYNGADDNASGTAVVMALAKRWATEGAAKRSIVFMTFSGEERGLLGSWATVRQELLPLDNIKFMLNLDMVGRNPDEPIAVFGDGIADGLRDIIEQANESTQLELRYRGRSVPSNSDHYPFYSQDIPVLMFFTGLHDDYHQVGDHAEKLDYERMAKIAELSYRSLREIANRPYESFPHFLHFARWLGLQLEIENVEEGRVARITDLADVSRAFDAGLRVGDVIVSVDGQTIEPVELTARVLRDVEAETMVEVGVLRDGRTRAFHVTRPRTGYLGIQPRSIREEERRELGLLAGEGVRAARVVGDGPAAKAGLRNDDILLEIDGHGVDSGNLIDRLQHIGAGETVEILVLRSGRRVRFDITLGQRP